MVTLGFPRKQFFPGQSVSGSLFVWRKLPYILPPWAPLKSEVKPLGLEGSHCVFSVSWSREVCFLALLSSVQWPWQGGPPQLTLDFGLYFPQIIVIPGGSVVLGPEMRPEHYWGPEGYSPAPTWKPPVPEHSSQSAGGNKVAPPPSGLSETCQMTPQTTRASAISSLITPPLQLCCR